MQNISREAIPKLFENVKLPEKIYVAFCVHKNIYWLNASRPTDPFVGDGWMFGIISCRALLCDCAWWYQFLLLIFWDYQDDDHGQNIQVSIFLTTYAELKQLVAVTLAFFFWLCYFSCINCVCKIISLQMCQCFLELDEVYRMSYLSLNLALLSVIFGLLIGWMYIGHTAFLTFACKGREESMTIITTDRKSLIY